MTEDGVRKIRKLPLVIERDRAYKTFSMVKEKEKRSSAPANALVRSSASFISQETFDVNTFLKKTLSNFSVDKGNHHQSHTTDEESSSNDDKRNGRSSSSSSGRKNKTRAVKYSDNIPSTTARKSCAYCGRKFANGEYSSDLYCVDCYHYFTQKSRSAIKSRLENMAGNENSGGAAETSNLVKTKRKRDDPGRSSVKNKNAAQPPQRRSAGTRRPHRDGSPSRQQQNPRYQERNNSQQIPVRIPVDRPKQSSKSILEKSVRRSSPAASRQNSWSSSSSAYPTCRICHLPGELGESLITPCRCSGTVQYVHTTCLVVSNTHVHMHLLTVLIEL